MTVFAWAFIVIDLQCSLHWEQLAPTLMLAALISAAMFLQALCASSMTHWLSDFLLESAGEAPSIRLAIWSSWSKSHAGAGTTVLSKHPQHSPAWSPQSTPVSPAFCMPSLHVDTTQLSEVQAAPPKPQRPPLRTKTSACVTAVVGVANKLLADSQQPSAPLAAVSVRTVVREAAVHEISAGVVTVVAPLPSTAVQAVHEPEPSAEKVPMLQDVQDCRSAAEAVMAPQLPQAAAWLVAPVAAPKVPASHNMHSGPVLGALEYLPPGQSVHAATPAVEYVPAPHWLQTATPAVAVTVPATQSLQVSPDTLVWPASQLAQAASEVEAAGAALPASQLAQAVPPTPYLPAAQLLQSVAMMLPAALDVPAPQAAQSPSFAATVAFHLPAEHLPHGCWTPFTAATGNVPAPQAAQLAAAVVPGGLDVPVAQVRQSDSASASPAVLTTALYLPPGQSVHAVWLAAALYLPVGQRLHAAVVRPAAAL